MYSLLCLPKTTRTSLLRITATSVGFITTVTCCSEQEKISITYAVLSDILLLCTTNIKCNKRIGFIYELGLQQSGYSGIEVPLTPPPMRDAVVPFARLQRHLAQSETALNSRHKSRLPIRCNLPLTQLRDTSHQPINSTFPAIRASSE